MGCMLIDHKEPVAILNDPVCPEGAAEDPVIRLRRDVEKAGERLLLVEFFILLRSVTIFCIGWLFRCCSEVCLFVLLLVNGKSPGIGA